MINWCQFVQGFPLDLKNVGSKVFTFTDGVNVLFGSNGVGKSVILKTLRSYTGIQKGGWSKISDPAIIGTGLLGTMSEALDFPHAYSFYSPSRCKANVSWDGVPCFFNDGDIKVSDHFFYHNVGQSDDGITNEAEQFDALVKKPSSGQYRLEKINKVFAMISGGPPYNEIDSIPPNILKKDAAQRELNYWNFLRGHVQVKRPTILLDEPERSLSIPKQKILLTELIPNHMRGYQIIMATHSPFALCIPNANIIDLEPGYKEECLKILRASFSEHAFA